MNKCYRALFLVAPLAAFLPASALVGTAEKTRLRPATPAEASLLVKVRGPGVCSGAPVLGTNLVVTAAHCVVEKGTGEVGSRYDLRVERDGTRYDVDSVLFDWSWFPKPGPVDQSTGIDSTNDVAILVLKEPIPAPGVSIAESFDGSASVSLVGYQPRLARGSWLRGSNYDAAVNAVGSSPSSGSQPAACSASPAELSRTAKSSWSVPCGMIPGASGGPVLVSTGAGAYELVGVISGVNHSLTQNYAAPVEKVLSLLAAPDRYRHSLSAPSHTAGIGK